MQYWRNSDFNISYLLQGINKIYYNKHRRVFIYSFIYFVSRFQ